MAKIKNAYPRPGGGHTIRVTINGVRHSRETATMSARQLEREVRAFKAELEARKPSPPGKITVAEVIDHFIASGDRAKRTNQGYLALARCLTSAFATAPAGSIGVAPIEAELRRVVTQHGTATAVAVFRLLRAALAEAERLELIERSPMRKVRAPKHTQKAKVQITGEQIAQIIARSEASGRRDLAACWRFAAVTGARRGELAALKWSDFDWAASRVTIARGISAGEETTTKTGRVKTIALDARTVTVMEAWRDRCAVDAMALGLPIPERVWPRDHGSDMWRHPDTFSHAWERARAGIADGVRLHDLRHFAASVMLASGVDVVTAAERQGHSPAVMLGVYAHGLVERDRAAAEVLGDALG